MNLDRPSPTSSHNTHDQSHTQIAAPLDQERADKFVDQGRAKHFSSHVFNLVHVCDYIPVDQPVHQCLDTLHRHYARYTDRPNGGMLPKDIDRISSLFY